MRVPVLLSPCFNPGVNLPHHATGSHSRAIRTGNQPSAGLPLAILLETDCGDKLDFYGVASIAFNNDDEIIRLFLAVYDNELAGPLFHVFHAVFLVLVGKLLSVNDARRGLDENLSELFAGIERRHLKSR